MTDNPRNHGESQTDTLTFMLSCNPLLNSFQCFSFPLVRQEPATVRKKFLQLSLLLHPDKNSHPQAKEAFQKLAAAFETLYDADSQAKHLEEVLVAAAAPPLQPQAKRQKHAPPPQPDWKQKRQKKQKKKCEWTSRRWEDVIRELKRRETLEKEFRQRKSEQQRARRVQGMIWKAMRVCRALDEQAGCPPTFVNGLWAPLFEQEVLRSQPASGVPTDWEVVWRNTDRLYREVATGRDYSEHPVKEVESLLSKARAALETNKTCFHTEPRKFLDEIVEYLREDYDYKDMDDDVLELEQEERALGEDHPKSSQEYDY